MIKVDRKSINRACANLILSCDKSGATIHDNPATQLAPGTTFPAWWILNVGQSFEHEIGRRGLFSCDIELVYIYSRTQLDTRKNDIYYAMADRILEVVEFAIFDDYECYYDENGVFHETPATHSWPVHTSNLSWSVEQDGLHIKFTLKLRCAVDVARNALQSFTLDTEVE